jgi:hypothetical protein
VSVLVGNPTKKHDPAPERSAHLSRLHYRIDTVFGQLTGRYSVRRVWAEETFGTWPAGCCRKVLSHTVAFLLDHRAGSGLCNSLGSSLETRTSG